MMGFELYTIGCISRMLVCTAAELYRSQVHGLDSVSEVKLARDIMELSER